MDSDISNVGQPESDFIGDDAYEQTKARALQSWESPFHLSGEKMKSREELIIAQAHGDWITTTWPDSHPDAVISDADATI